MGDLADWAQKHSPFLKIADNSEVLVMYKGYKEIEDNRNPGQMKIRYIVELDGDDKWFESAAARVAMSMDSVQEGEFIKIKKEVKGSQTRYFVETEKKEEEEEINEEPLPFDEKKPKKKK